MFKMNQGTQVQMPPTPVVWLDADASVEYMLEIAAELSVEQLNTLGGEGWQLAAILPRKNDAVYYFMRSSSPH